MHKMDRNQLVNAFVILYLVFRLIRCADIYIFIHIHTPTHIYHENPTLWKNFQCALLLREPDFHPRQVISPGFVCQLLGALLLPSRWSSRPTSVLVQRSSSLFVLWLLSILTDQLPSKPWAYSIYSVSNLSFIYAFAIFKMLVMSCPYGQLII